LVKVGVSSGTVLEGRDATHGGLLKHAERVALSDELVNVSSRKSSLEQKHDILNHVFVGDEIQKGSKRLN
jgi:hypothetical protein